MAGLKDGSVGAIFTGSWDYNNIVDAIGEENVGAAILPTITIDGAEKQLLGFTGSKAIGVNPHCEDQEVAVALAAYLGSEEGQRLHYELRNVIPANSAVAADENVQSNLVAAAESAHVANSSMMQPFVGKMGNWWTPAENFGKSLMAKEVTHDNAAEMTESLNTSANTSAVE